MSSETKMADNPESLGAPGSGGDADSGQCETAVANG